MDIESKNGAKNSKLLSNKAKRKEKNNQLMQNIVLATIVIFTFFAANIIFDAIFDGNIILDVKYIVKILCKIIISTLTLAFIIKYINIEKKRK